MRVGDRVYYLPAINDGENYRDWTILEFRPEDYLYVRRVSDEVVMVKKRSMFCLESAVDKLARLIE
jgi:hypothetical protein